jgi:hypothetical protein
LPDSPFANESLVTIIFSCNKFFCFWPPFSNVVQCCRSSIVLGQVLDASIIGDSPNVTREGYGLCKYCNYLIRSLLYLNAL